jgi:acetyltransferase-like isoleucine patch superfamily enzyme
MFKNYFNIKKMKKKYKNIKIGGNSYFEYIENIHFKNYAYIGPHAYWSGKGKITIGNNVIFGPKTVLWTYSHNYDSSEYIPYGNSKEDIVKDIAIEDNVWIGLGVIILPGVTISEGAVIGMNSVVTKNIPSCAIAVGNPAIVIKYRNKKKYEKLKLKNKLYLESKI